MSAGRMSDTRLVAAAAVLTVLLAAAGAYLAPRPEAGGGAGSSFSAGARGAQAAYDTLRALGHDVQRSVEPLTAIAAEPARTLLVITGPLPPSDQDTRAMREFLAAGGAAVLVGQQGAALLGLQTGAQPVDPAEPAEYEVRAVSPLTRGVAAITMDRGPGTVTLPASHLPLAAVSAGEPLVTTARIGKGRVTWLAAVTPIANASIRDAGNLQLLLNIAGPPGERRILWDEHYHGYSRSLWSYAAATPLPWAIAQGGLLLLAAILTFSRRRLPVRSRGTATRTSPLEFIEMLRILYARAGGASAAVAIARTRLRRRVSSLSGLPAGARDEQVASAAAARLNAPAEEIAALLTQPPAGADLDVRGALRLTARLQDLSNELDAPRRA
jgi:hypothetical protein